MHWATFRKKTNKNLMETFIFSCCPHIALNMFLINLEEKFLPSVNIPRQNHDLGDGDDSILLFHNESYES